MTVLARLLIGLAIVVPSLGWLPWSSPVLGVLTAGFTLAAAFHGAGLVVARLARRPVDPWLGIQWGIAALIALGGLAMLLRISSPLTTRLLIGAALVVHTIVLLRERVERSNRLASALRESTRLYWLLPLAVLALLGMLYTLGAAGDTGARPFDDNGNVLAQIRRLLDTGTLSDPVGFPRASQLGGQVVLGAFASIVGDLAFTRWLDNGLCLVLTMCVALHRMRPRDGGSALWALLLLIASTALPFAPADPSACWSAVGLLVGLYVTLEEHRDTESALPIALLAGALATVRSELVPIGLVALVAACSIGHRPWRDDLRRIALVIAVASGVVLPYLITRYLAWSDAPATIRAVLLSGGSALAHLGLFLGVFAVSAAVLVLATERPVRWAAIATAAGVAGIVSQLAGARPYALQFVWPIALALVIVVVIDLARRAHLRMLGLVISLLACVVIYEGRDASGRLRWSRRLSNLVYNADFLSHAASPRMNYSALLAEVPAGATVAIWVAHPELLDYGRHRIYDLRTPGVDRLRMHRWSPHTSRIDGIVDELAPDYLLLENDHEPLERMRSDPFARFWCVTPRPECADDLERLTQDHETILTSERARLLRLR